jgi:hypothetical protein
MIYLPKKDAEEFRRYARRTKLSGSQIAKEGIAMRMAGESDPFNQGFNAGLNEAMNLVRQTKGAQMMFPSGKSFAQLVCEEIEKYLREKANEQ